MNSWRTFGLLISMRRFAITDGKMYATLSKSGRTIEFNDCLIAATVQSLGMNEIVTRNCDHFNRINGCTALLPKDLAF
ncbi:hypothetical protein [Methanoregula sp.]|uniref:hypothetical protein n=1 Tax=Methanoregula sp. TaxID=2052170 RepID=UPI0023732DB2|nr:hypothetical protein [Methanoregula sp.]MDD1687246.1 hypothetical protein [Methanoregula sp.]